MKCPTCDGKGEYMHQCGGYRPCEHCNGTGKIKVTNEEWFCSLSTEEKADLLSELVWWIHPSVQGGRKVELTKESFLRWLKEKHNA